MTSSKDQLFFVIIYMYICSSAIAFPTSSVFEANPPYCNIYRRHRGEDNYCSGQLKFNEKIQACDLSPNVNDECNHSNATTTDTTYSVGTPPTFLLNDPECADVVLSYNPHPYDCKKFSVCYDSKKWYLDCPEDLYFDKNSKMCKNLESSTCFVDSRCKMDVDFLPHPTDCSSYIQCYFNISYAQKCPEEMWFNSNLKLCTSREDSKCVVTEPTWASHQLQCEYDVKTKRSTNGCRFYVHCNSGQGTLRACPDGTAYSAKNQLCSAANLEKCTDYGYTVAAWTTQPTQAPDPLSYGFPPCGSHGKFFPHPSDRSKFIECIESRGVERNCPEGLIYTHQYDRYYNSDIKGRCS